MMMISKTLMLGAAVAQAKLLMNYQSDSHGTYVALVCPNNTTKGPCQLNAHVISMVAPESILHGLRVGGYYEVDGTGIWEPMAVESEYMTWNGSSPRVTTGRVSKQYKGMLQASTFARPETFCAKIWAEDMVTGDYAELEKTCLDVAIEAPKVPQVPKLEAHVNHYALTYYCEGDDDCVMDGHMIISTYATDPTHPVYGGGSYSVDGGKTFISKGVRVLNQAKPSHSNVLDEVLGPRIQVSIEKRGKKEDIVPDQLCFSLWVVDTITHEMIDVLDNDAGEPLPPPTKPGLFCYEPYLIRST